MPRAIESKYVCCTSIFGFVLRSQLLTHFYSSFSAFVARQISSMIFYIFFIAEHVVYFCAMLTLKYFRKCQGILGLGTCSWQFHAGLNGLSVVGLWIITSHPYVRIKNLLCTLNWNQSKWNKSTNDSTCFIEWVIWHAS